MSKECQICKTALEDDSLYCPNCGWELVVIPDSASKQLKRIINEKELLYKQNYDRYKNTSDELTKSTEEISKLKEELAKEKEKFDNSSLYFCVLKCSNGQIFVLQEGTYSFGHLGLESKTHKVIDGEGIETPHFELDVEFYKDDPQKDYSVNIKNRSQNGFLLNGIKTNNGLTKLEHRDEITVGNIKISILIVSNL